jgi:hypothetical protein
MATTRPKLEQVEFRSAKTGSHVLDDYLEASEYGSRTLPDLLNDLFGNDGNLRTDIFEFRVNETTLALQTRRGLYLDPNSNWVNVPNGFFFRPRGAWAPNTAYEVHDLYLYQQSLFMVTAPHTSNSVEPDFNKSTVVISGIAGRIPVEDAELLNKADFYLKVRSDENGYELVESTVKPTFYGFTLSNNGTDLIQTSARDEDFNIKDFDAHFIGDLGYTFAIRKNELVVVMQEPAP